MDYTLPIYLSFSLVALSSFGLFFTRSFAKVPFYAFLTLLGVLVNFANKDSFISGDEGQIVGLFILLAFMMQWMYVQKLLKSKRPPKRPVLFYALPFLAFVFMATARDLVTLFLSLELFFSAVFTLWWQRGKSEALLQKVVRLDFVSFLGFAYGLSFLYLTKGTLALVEWNLILRQRSVLPSLIFVAVGLLGWSLLIKIKIFLMLKNEK